VTIPRHAGQLPVYYNAKKSKRYWIKNGWGHPYVDLEPTPLYPFGFGLSYTRFEYSDLALSAREIGPAGEIEVHWRVKNVGARAGAEVAQLYLEDVVSSVSTPVRELRGFTKIMLQPGETKTCAIKLTPADLALYNAKLERVVEPGQFRVMIGASSEDLRLRGEFGVVAGGVR
jgi:beta-glucosidase